jgi:hypothetical protein
MTSTSFLAVNIPGPQMTDIMDSQSTPFNPPLGIDSAPIPDEISRTPTRNSFISIPEQKPLPDVNGSSENSPLEIKMEVEEDMDITNEIQDDNEAGSPQDSGDPDGKKKKKSTRFFCTGYPPCKLSFTRSEHLARHIRYVA